MRNARYLLGILSAAALLSAGALVAQDNGSDPIVKQRPQFSHLEGTPACFQMSTAQGDPSKGASVIVIRGTAGCRIPWHWHTPNEQVMVSAGTGRFQMKDQKPVLVRAGSFAYMPSKHVHQMTCVTNCMVFVRSDDKFDIHYVDASGKEIPPEQALKSGRSASHRRAAGSK